jgi:hypothetical protein
VIDSAAELSGTRAAGGAVDWAMTVTVAADVSSIKFFAGPGIWQVPDRGLAAAVR